MALEIRVEGGIGWYLMIGVRPVLIQLHGATPEFRMKHASQLYALLRDQCGEGASTFPDGTIRTGTGEVVARVSYNGKVWPPRPWKEGDEPLYTPKGDV